MRTVDLGILTHADTGKTSLTERLLHEAGEAVLETEFDSYRPVVGRSPVRHATGQTRCAAGAYLTAVLRRL